MSQKIQFRRGSLAEVGSTIFDQGEPVWITDQHKLYIGDGVTPGGVLWNVENPTYLSGSIANAVYTTGNQTISGVKKFDGVISGFGQFGVPYVIDLKNGWFFAGGTGLSNLVMSLGGSLGYNGLDSINWFDRITLDQNGIDSIYYDTSRSLVDSNSISTLKWGTKQLTGLWNTNGLKINDNLNINISNKSFIYTGNSTSYSNYLGTGQRSGYINLTSNISFNGNMTGFINGIQNESVFYFNAPQSGSGKYLTFDFGQPKTVTEAKFYQDLTSTHSRCKWYGSNDNISLTQLTDNFLLGGSTTQIQSGLSSNVNPYRYYTLSGNSGELSNAPFLREYEFKIADEINTPYLFANGKTLAGKEPTNSFYPTAYLHLNSGNTGALSSPLKFTSGRLLTGPEKGAMEYSNNSLFLTDETYTRKMIPAITNPPTAFNSAGLSGSIAFDSDYMYVCTANNSWKRTLLEVW